MNDDGVGVAWGSRWFDQHEPHQQEWIQTANPLTCSLIRGKITAYRRCGSRFSVPPRGPQPHLPGASRPLRSVVPVTTTCRSGTREYRKKMRRFLIFSEMTQNDDFKVHPQIPSAGYNHLTPQQIRRLWSLIRLP